MKAIEILEKGTRRWTVQSRPLYFLEEPADKNDNTLLKGFAAGCLGHDNKTKMQPRWLPRLANTLLVETKCGHNNKGIDQPLPKSKIDYIRKTNHAVYVSALRQAFQKRRVHNLKQSSTYVTNVTVLSKSMLCLQEDVGHAGGN